MTAPETPALSGMSIGAVLDLLRPDFPDVTISKIRFLEAEEKRSAAFDKSSSERFVPWVMPVQPPSQAAPEAKLTE